MPTDNPYLQGNFGPVDRESTFTELRVSGELPKDLNGLLLRNGPNPIGPIDDKHHWFVGDAMLHAVHVENGQARGYRNRYVRTTHVQEVLGLPAAPRAAQPYPIQGSGNVNVVEHAGRILALPEVGLPYLMDHALGTLREYDFDGALRTSMTAHPKIDPVSGELVFFGYDFGPTHLRVHLADARGKLVRTVDIATPRPTMIHDIGVTQSSLVLMDMPVVFDLDLVAQGYRLPFRWQEGLPSRIGVQPRSARTDETRWLEIAPCYVYHVLNAYDDGAQIVMDVIRYDRTFDRDRRGPIEDSLGKLVRWRIDAARGTLVETLTDDAPQEFPRVDPRRETLAHRYGYTVEVDPNPERLGFTALLQHDLQAGTRTRHDFGAGRAPGEGVFVPSGPAENAGYVLTAVYDSATQTSDVVVLDAQDFAAPPLATIHLPVRIPFGFHGNFVSLG
jgi:carotenoid cleavage oxygenase